MTTTRLVSAGRRIGFALALISTTLLAGSAVRAPSTATASPTTRPRTDWAPPNAGTAGSASLTKPGLPLTAGPVAVPLELRLPTLLVAATVLGVGIDAAGAMDAPMGAPGDPVWQQTFWYRGSSVPGAFSTAVIAGHVDGGGQPGAFAHLDDLRPGDPIVVHNTKTGVDLGYTVTGSESIPLEQTTDPAVLSRIYGVGPVVGSRPLASTDGRSHLTLITCAGTFRDGTHDHRLVVHATRVT
jgi:Sortase domain